MEKASERSEEADVVIVGAGVIGLACAWRLAERGERVLVLERERPGAGASGVAAGMLAPVGETSFGEDALLALRLRSRALWPRFAAELAAASGREVGMVESGALHVALDRDEAEALRRRYELMISLGLEARWLRARGCRELEPGLSPNVSAGVSAPGDAAIEPRRLAGALLTAAGRAGAEVRSGATVEEVVLDGGAVAGVRTAEGAEHPAASVVLACGAWSGARRLLPEDLRPPVRPVKGQILTLLGPDGRPPCDRIVVGERVYMVPRLDGSLVVGATVEEMGFDRRITAGGVHELLREAYRALPEIAEMELTETVAGLRPGTPDNAPLIGATETPGLVLATGHFRNGILLAPLTAEAVTSVVRGEEPPAEIGVADPSRFASAVPR